MVLPLDDIRAVKKEFSDWLSMKNSNGHVAIGVGLKETYGQRSDELAIQFFVETKESCSSVSRDSIIPKFIDGIPTDVRTASTPQFMAGRTRPTKAEIASAMRNRKARARTRPLVGGLSCANQFVPAGTLGYFCTKNGDLSNATYLVSNGHVFRGKSQYKKSSAILQASPSDGGSIKDAVADFEKTSALNPAKDARNIADVAIAKLRNGIEYKLEIQNVGSIKGIAKPYPGMKVGKVGRTSGLTQGVVTAIDYETAVPWGVREVRETYQFKGQIRIESGETSEPFAQFGDSGALVFSDSGHAAVGLYFAGATDGSYGLATPIPAVEKVLGIKLLV